MLFSSMSPSFYALYPRLSRKTQQRLLGFGLALTLLTTAPAAPQPTSTSDPYANPFVQQALTELNPNTPDTAGDQFQVNSYTTGVQRRPTVALDSDGDFVVIWQSDGSNGDDTSGDSIQGQRYNSVGTAQGSQFQVNSYTNSNQRFPAVAMDSDGDFVVVWTSNGSSDSDTSNYSIQGQRYNSLGTTQGSQFQVNSYTTDSQRFPTVAMDSDGDFVVAWQSYGSLTTDTATYSIQGQRYNSLGTAQGSQFQVNSYTSNLQLYPAVALDSDGDFVVIWQSYGSDFGDTASFSIQGQRYNSVGTLAGIQFQVNTYTTGSQSEPAVSRDSDGDFVVVWQSNGSSLGDTSSLSIQGKRYNSVGTVQGLQFQVNGYTTNQQRNPAVALDSDGDFVVVWESDGSSSDDTSFYSVQGRAFRRTAQALWGEFQVNSYTTNSQLLPVVALDSNGDFVVAWGSNGSNGSDSSADSIQANQFDLGQSDHQVNTYTTNQQRSPDVAMDSDGDFVVIWASYGSYGDDTSSYSIQGQRYDSFGTVQGSQFQINTYTTGFQSSPAVAMDDDGDFVVVWESYGSSDSDTSSTSIQGQRYNSLGAALGGQFQINSYTTDSQSFPDVAMDSDGDFVVVWFGYGSYGSDAYDISVQGQRYDSLGTPLGSQFQANSYTTGWQRFPAIAMDSDGDFVVAWQSYGSYGSDNWLESIQGQRYDSLGVPQATQFQVNSYTTNGQFVPDVALDDNGDFVVVWHSAGSSGGDNSVASVLGKRYNSLGVVLGGEFQVNTFTPNLQALATVALDSDGDFVVTWMSYGSNGNDNSFSSVHGRRYNSVGTAQGSQFQINAYTTSYQRYSHVAMDSDGDFVVVWQSNGSSGNLSFGEITPDTDGYSILATRFNELGAPVPTAIKGLTAHLQPSLPLPFAGVLATLGAVLTGVWLWLGGKQRRP